MKKLAIIIGAGPAGLTAAYELLTKTEITPIVIEADSQVGGLSKTINYKGNKIDIGGHRFFSRSADVIKWWLHFLPLDPAVSSNDIKLQYQQQSTVLPVAGTTSLQSDRKMLLRPRKSRIYYQRKFFDYPLQLNSTTIANLGAVKMARIASSYLYAKLFPIKPASSLAQFFVNRFGKELYETFFKDYTEKVWGVPCEQLPASWGQQRVKDLNVSRLLQHAVTSLFSTDKTLQQKDTSTSLIEQFLYPQYGPGQMWETVAEEIIKLGGQILLNTSITGLQGADNAITVATGINTITQQRFHWQGDYFFSSMPVRQLISQLKGIDVPPAVQEAAASLEYRDFLVVGILTNSLSVHDQQGGDAIKDNWIYVQDKQVKAGRIQIFNNWSPGMVKDPADTWIGVEYFCNETDAFWKMSDEEVASTAVREMETIGILTSTSVKDSMVARVKKAYPSYHGGYEQFGEVQAFTDTIENLFLIGRNGMHRYNNSDHSMLTAMQAVDNIISGRTDKSNIWEINTEELYHEDTKKND